MSHPFSREALWDKAKVFMERGLVARSEGEHEEWPLWASLAAELLGKAVLASIHPVLVAHPGNDDTANSLLAAAGVEIKEGGLQSIAMKTVLSRLAKVLPAEFDGKVQAGLKLIADMRNEELHSGAIPFTGLPEHAWAPGFWRAIDVLLKKLGKSVRDFVGGDFESLVAELINATTQEVEAEVKKRMGESKARWKVRSSDHGGEDQYREDVSSRMKPSWRKTWALCPVCGCKGYLGHSEVLLSSVRRADEVGVEIEEKYRADTFRCEGCSLELDGTAHLAVARLPVDVTEKSAMEFSELARDDESDYGND